MQVLRRDIPLSTASLTISDDTAAGDFTEGGELALQPILIDVPAKVADEQVLDALAGRLLSLGLLLSRLSLGLSLALLGGGLLLLAGLLGGLFGVGLGVGVGSIGVAGVIGILSRGL
jgi:hypothetical protein